MAIEIVVGLPHLANGAILARARAMQQPMLISANCLSRWGKAAGWAQWRGWRTSSLRNAKGLASLDLDSAGYSMMVKYRGLPWTIADYMGLAASYPFRRFAAVDYCCEAEVANDRSEVRERISRTIRTNRECHARAVDLDIVDRLMPVLQGRNPDDYERCLDGISTLLIPGTIIGIGSMCRRRTHGAEGLVAVVERLDKVLPDAVFCHAFGVKGSALPWLKPFERRIVSIDSQAYGIAARRDARRLGVAKTDRLVAAHMDRWCRVQLKRTAEPARISQIPATVPEARLRDDAPWTVAIEAAEAEIRSLIECGELDHDEITAQWIESWAADICHASSGSAPHPVNSRPRHRRSR